MRAPAARGTLSGVVRDARGAALADARVVAFGLTASGLRQRTATSAADGSWSIPGLSDGFRYMIRATKAGYGTRWTDGHLDSAGRPTVKVPSSTADFVLPIAADQGVLTGTVNTLAATPVGGLRVDLFGPVGALARTTTDGAGRYRFTGITPGGRYRVRVAAADATYERVWATTDGRGTDRGWSDRSSLLFTVAAGAVAVVPPVAVAPPADARSLTVRLRSTDLRPVGGVEVWLYASGPDPGFVAAGRTDDDGVLEVSGLRPDTYIAWARSGEPGCPIAGLADQWFNGVPGGEWDLSDRLADPIDVRTTDRTVDFTLR